MRPPADGKTTLLSQCAAAFEQRVAWVSLDESDDDPVVLLSEIASAVDRVVPVDPMVFSYLLSPDPPIRTEVVPRLLNSLADSPELALLLDDVHVVRAESSASILTLICEHLPANMRLVLAAREVPRLPLGRLRAGGSLLELGADELAFSRSEARELLDSVRVPLEPEGFDWVYERTEGWAAGLYLAALSTLESSDPSRALREFGGDDRNVFDYFSGEFLRYEPAARLSFLLRTSVLDRFSAPLCDAVLERNDSATMLAELEQCNRFLVPLDHRREWFRYHHLFGEMLRTELARVEPSTAARLRARASDWHEQRGNLPEAIEHALAGGARARTADLLARNLRVLFNTGHQTRIQRWLAAFSDADLAECPPLAAGAAWVMGLVGARALTGKYLSNLEHSSFRGTLPFGESSTQSAVARLKATLAWEGVSQMRLQAELAYHSEAPGTAARARAAAALGANLWLRGRAAQAGELLCEAANLGDAGAHTALLAIGVLTLMYLKGGRLDAAEGSIREGFALMDHGDLQNGMGAAGMWAARAWLSVEHGDLESADSDLSRAVARLPLTAAMPWWSISLGIATGRVARELHQFSEAESLLGQARHELVRYPDARRSSADARQRGTSSGRGS